MEGESGRMGRSGDGWKPKSERRLEERKGKMGRERRKTGEGKETSRGEEEKEQLRSVQFDDHNTLPLLLPLLPIPPQTVDGC